MENDQIEKNMYLKINMLLMKWCDLYYFRKYMPIFHVGFNEESLCLGKGHKLSPNLMCQTGVVFIQDLLWKASLTVMGSPHAR